MSLAPDRSTHRAQQPPDPASTSPAEVREGVQETNRHSSQRGRSNLWLIAGLLAVFLAMGLVLLSFLLDQRKRAASGDYGGLDQALSGDSNPEPVDLPGENLGSRVLHPRSSDRPSGTKGP